MKAGAQRLPITFDEFGFYEVGSGSCLDAVVNGAAMSGAAPTNGMCNNDVCIQVDGVNHVCQQLPPLNRPCIPPVLDASCNFPDMMCAMCSC